MGTNTNQGTEWTIISQTKWISTSLEIWLCDHCPCSERSEADDTDCSQDSSFFQLGNSMSIPGAGSSSVRNTAPVSSGNGEVVRGASL